MPEQLLKAVNDLTGAVTRLEDALHEYPKRSELEDKYTTKKESKTRALNYLVIGLAIMIIAFLISFAVTIGTVSTCFISAEARAGAATSACQILPGYTEAQKENQHNLKLFRELLEQPALNDKRLDELEKELGFPPEPTEG